MQSQPTGYDRYRPRVSMACTNCRRRKVKCITREDPPQRPCERCTKRGYTCDYAPVDVSPDARHDEASSGTRRQHSGEYPQQSMHSSSPSPPNAYSVPPRGTVVQQSSRPGRSNPYPNIQPMPIADYEHARKRSSSASTAYSSPPHHHTLPGNSGLHHMAPGDPYNAMSSYPSMGGGMPAYASSTNANYATYHQHGGGGANSAPANMGGSSYSGGGGGGQYPTAYNQHAQYYASEQQSQCLCPPNQPCYCGLRR